MENILSQKEAESIIEQLSEGEKVEIERDKIRFGEYFIAETDNHYYRVNPINVVIEDGKPSLVDPASETMI